MDGPASLHPAREIAQRASLLDATTLADHLIHGNPHTLTSPASRWTWHLDYPQRNDSDTGHITTPDHHPPLSLGKISGKLLSTSPPLSSPISHSSPQSTSLSVDLITDPTLLDLPCRQQIFSLFQSTIKGAYHFNDAWNPEEKRSEMFDDQNQARWILLWKEGGERARERTGQSSSSSELVGFILWRFDVEECTRQDWQEWQEEGQYLPTELLLAQKKQRKTIALPLAVRRGPGGKARAKIKLPRPKVERLLPVGYCYELHLSPSYSSLGLGSFLLSSLQIISQRTGMCKVMLTCWRCNTAALRFYLQRCQGWKVAGISPWGVEGGRDKLKGQEDAGERNGEGNKGEVESNLGDEEEERKKGYVILSFTC